MRALPVRARGILAAGLAAAVISVPLIGTAAAAGSATSASQAASDRAAAGHAAGPAASRPLPQQLFAPYFETWTKNSIPAVATKSGARYFTLAFLQTPEEGLLHGGLEWRPQAGRPSRRALRARDRPAALDGRQRDPVLRRVQR